MPRLTPFYYLLLLVSISAAAQKPLYGHIKRQLTTEVLPSVTVLNRTQGKHNISDAGGNYRIDARPGDTIIFSSAGYLPDTKYVAAWMLEEKNGRRKGILHRLSLPSRLGRTNNRPTRGLTTSFSK